MTTIIVGLLYVLSEVKKYKEGKAGLGQGMASLVSDARSGKSADKTFVGGLKTLGGRALDMLGMPSTEEAAAGRESRALLAKQTPLMLGGKGGNTTNSNSTTTQTFMFDGKDFTNMLSDGTKKEFTNSLLHFSGGM